MRSVQFGLRGGVMTLLSIHAPECQLSRNPCQAARRAAAGDNRVPATNRRRRDRWSDAPPAPSRSRRPGTPRAVSRSQVSSRPRNSSRPRSGRGCATWLCSCSFGIAVAHQFVTRLRDGSTLIVKDRFLEGRCKRVHPTQGHKTKSTRLRGCSLEISKASLSSSLGRNGRPKKRRPVQVVMIPHPREISELLPWESRRYGTLISCGGSIRGTLANKTARIIVLGQNQKNRQNRSSVENSIHASCALAT